MKKILGLLFNVAFLLSVVAFFAFFGIGEKNSESSTVGRLNKSPYQSSEEVQECTAVSAPFTTERETTDFQEFFGNLFGHEFILKSRRVDEVYIGGIPLGFTIYGDGVIIVSVGEVETENQNVSPCLNSLIPGDILIEINGVRIDSAKKIDEILNSKDSQGLLTVELTVLRDKKRLNFTVFPAIDKTVSKRKLGLWVKDTSAGVGTLTFVCGETGRFGALGHPVCDYDTGKVLPAGSGKIFDCTVVGVQKGGKGKAGELRGVFMKSSSSIGEITKNNEFGVFGTFNQEKYDGRLERKVKVASREEIKPGKASIISTVSGTEPKEYEIEIIKTSHQAESKSKSMVIRITDKELLEVTGGIVQGMSGSPILQNGKLVGAVTHVFVSDSTKGFGIYADWMLE